VAVHSPVIKSCPTCGSKKFRRVRRNWKNSFKSQTYVVPALEFWECPDCGEEAFDHAAMQKIAAHSPAYVKRRGTRRAAAG